MKGNKDEKNQNSPLWIALKEHVETAADTTDMKISVTELEQLLMELGEYYYKKGDSINALNCFNRILQINGQNYKAKTYAEMILNVLNYYNKDLLNP